MWKRERGKWRAGGRGRRGGGGGGGGSLQRNAPDHQWGFGKGEIRGVVCKGTRASATWASYSSLLLLLLLEQSASLHPPLLISILPRCRAGATFLYCYSSELFFFLDLSPVYGTCAPSIYSAWCSPVRPDFRTFACGRFYRCCAWGRFDFPQAKKRDVVKNNK